jgi:hypothetical protein
MTPFARMQVPTTLELEDRATREVVLYRLGAASPEDDAATQPG